MCRDLVSHNGCLYASLGGGSGATEFGQIWVLERDRWRSLSLAGHAGERIGGRSRLVRHGGRVLCGLNYPESRSAEIHVLDAEADAPGPAHINADLAEHGVAAITSLWSVEGTLFVAGTRVIGVGQEPVILAFDAVGARDLTGREVPGGQAFRDAVYYPYCMSVFEGALIIGAFNQPHPRNRVGQVWRWTDDAGWDLISGGAPDDGRWDKDSSSVLAMSVYRGRLIVALMRARQTPPRYSSVWAWDGGAWEPIFGDLEGSPLALATHYNALGVVDGTLYCGIGSFYRDWHTPNLRGCPSLWRLTASGDWGMVGGEGLNGSWKADDFEPGPGGQCPYFYSIIEHAGWVFVATTSRIGGGCAQIWRLSR